VNTEQLRLLASAIKLGTEAAEAGRFDNPFEGADATLRMAFQLGIDMTRWQTPKLISEERLVALYGPGKVCNALADLT
jgi:hypothetical protein